jgi:tetratricopeptide (TPR) repeat protein
MAHGAYGEAANLYRKDSTTPGPAAARAHDALIRALLKQGHLTEAEADAHAWITAEPNSAWANLALGEVLWRQGKFAQAIPSISQASRIDDCIAQVHAEVATILQFSASYASARVQLNRAHQLDTFDDEIANAWFDMQPRSVKLEQLALYLKRTDLNEKQRKSAEEQQKRLSAPPEPSCHLTSAYASTSIPYRRIQDGPNAPIFWGLDVGINGKQRRLQIDTGASGLIVYKPAATALHLQPEVQFKSYGIGDSGYAASFAAKVQTIKIGGLEFADCYVTVVDRPKDPSTGDDAADGLIGGDVFESFLVTLDFPGHTLKLDPLPSPPGTQQQGVSLDTNGKAVDAALHDRYIDPSMKDWTKVFRSGHDLLLPVRLNGGQPRLFIVDTGSDLNLISPDSAREVVKVNKGADVDLSGISGKVNKLFTTGPLTLTFANLNQATTGMTAMDTTRFSFDTGIEVSGFIGAPTLHQLTVQIDYRDNLMHFSYDPKRLNRCVGGVNVIDCY